MIFPIIIDCFAMPEMTVHLLFLLVCLLYSWKVKNIYLRIDLNIFLYEIQQVTDLTFNTPVSQKIQWIVLFPSNYIFYSPASVPGN